MSHLVRALALAAALLVAATSSAYNTYGAASPLGAVSAGAAGGGSGSGTVSAGTSPQVAYYAANGTTVSGNAALQFPASEVVVNESGLAAMDFRVEGDTDANLLFADASTDRVGIGTNVPAAKLELAAGTITPTAPAFKITATGSGAGATNIFGVEFLLAAGYTGTSTSRVFQVTNSSAGTGSQPYGLQTGNFGWFASTSAVTTGTNIGGWGYGAGGNVNHGVMGVSRGDAAGDGKNVPHYGVTGVATRTSGVAVGGLFTLGDGAFLEPSSAISAALVADTKANVGFPIVAAVSGGVTVFDVTPAVLSGDVSASVTTAAASSFSRFRSVTSDTSSFAQLEGSGNGAGFVFRANGSAMATTFLGTSDASWSTLQNTSGNGFKIGVPSTGNQLLLGSFEPALGTSAVRATFNNDEMIINDPGNDFDFRVEGDTNANMLFVDASGDGLGIGTGTVTANTITSALVFQGPSGAVGAPTYSFSADTGTGFYRPSAGLVTMASAGSDRWTMGVNLFGAGGTGSASIAYAIGTASLPSFSFVGDTDTGMYRSAADTVGFTTGGTIRVSIATSTLTSTVNYISSGNTTDFTTTGNENLRLAPAGTGSVELMSGDSTVDFLDSAGTQRVVFLVGASVSSILTTTSVNVLRLGTNSGTSGTLPVAQFEDGARLWSIYGEGAVRKNVEQTATCAGGVLALDPVSSVITIDANATSCVVTLAETSAATIGTGYEAVINVTNAGTGVVTFPDVANIADMPPCASSIGITTNGTLSIEYANRANDLWIGTACVDNTTFDGTRGATVNGDTVVTAGTVLSVEVPAAGRYKVTLQLMITNAGGSTMNVAETYTATITAGPSFAVSAIEGASVVFFPAPVGSGAVALTAAASSYLTLETILTVTAAGNLGFTLTGTGGGTATLLGGSGLTVTALQ